QTSAGASRSVTVDETGNFVVTWASDNQDGNGWGIYAQHYDPTGNPLGAEFQVNTTTDSDQTSPAVASENQGNFVIVWQGKDQDGSGWGIFGRRYNPAGYPISGEFQINTTT